MRKTGVCATLTVAFALCLLSGPVFAQATGAGPDATAAAILNPLTNQTQLLITPTVAFPSIVGSEPESGIKFQPRVPFPLSSDWRVVTRTNVAILHTPANEQPMALGDIDTSLFLSPARNATWTWGVGPIIQLPTATKSDDGTGKWSAGPTAALLYVQGPWTNGVVVSHLRSFAGSASHDDVNLTQIEAQISYTFSNHWYVASAPTLEYDWHADAGQRWIVPVGVEGGREFSARSQDLSVQCGAYYNVQRPTGEAGWTLTIEFGWVLVTGHETSAQTRRSSQ
jgi:hypothetical protein